MKLEQELKIKNFTSERQKASINVLFTSGWLRQHFNKVLKPFNISQEQFNVLRIVRGSMPETLCSKDIAERMIERGSNVTRIIDKLVVKGLMERTQSTVDRREVQLVITEEGLSLLAQVGEISFPLDSNALNENEFQLLNGLLDKLRSS